MKYLFLVVLLVVSSSFQLLSQTSDSTYQQYLLNNKNVPKRIYYCSENLDILKTNLSAILDGNVPLIWEHRFNEYYAIDGGPGLILPYSMIDYFKNSELGNTNPFGLNSNFENKKLGFSYEIEPKLFLADNSLFINHNGYSFFSVFYKELLYSNLRIKELGVGLGITCDFDRTTIQMIFSICYDQQTLLDNFYNFKYLGPFSSVESNTANNLRLSLRLELGYILRSKKTIK